MPNQWTESDVVAGTMLSAFIIGLHEIHSKEQCEGLVPATPSPQRHGTVLWLRHCSLAEADRAKSWAEALFFESALSSSPTCADLAFSS